MEMESTREAILWQCFDEISFCGNEVKFITSDNEETYTRMSLLNFFSPLFSKMLGKIPLSNLTQDMIVVLLPSVKKTTLTKLLDVLNYGVTAAYTEIPDDDVEDLKDAAQILGIRGFSQLSGSLARISATEVFPRETLPIPLDYSIGVREEERRVVVEEEEDSSVEKEEENFAADLQQSNVDKEEDEKEEGEKLDCTSVEKTSQAFSQPSLEASYSSECGSSTPLASISSIPLPPTPEYSPQAPPKAKDAESEETKFQWESERGPQSRSIPTEMLEKRVEAAAPPVKKDHRVEKEKPRDRKSSNSSERRRAGVKRRRSHERVSENKNRNCRDRGSSSWRSSEGDITRGKRRVLLPKPEQFLRASDGPPVSSLPELQYIYDHKYHKLCGKQHRRIDLCDMAPGKFSLHISKILSSHWSRSNEVFALISLVELFYAIKTFPCVFMASIHGSIIGALTP